MKPYVIKLNELGMNDVEIVGGKNASLGEMISNLSNMGVTVPGGFATTAGRCDLVSMLGDGTSTSLGGRGSGNLRCF